MNGIFAAINGISTVRQWSLNITSDPRTYRASNTRGGTGRTKGVRDWTGSFGAYGSPIVFPGQTFNFKGYVGAASGVYNTAGPTYSGNAIVDSLSVAFNWQNGDIVSYTSNFSANGPIVETSETVVDTSDPDTPAFDTVSITLDEDGSGSGGFAEWCELLTATLNITAENKTATHSCSEGYRVREPGPIDWTLSVNVKNPSLAAMPFQISDNVPLRINIDSEYWLLKWAHVIGATGITANAETGDIAQMTIDFGKNAFANATLGTLRAPDGTIVWPGV